MKWLLLTLFYLITCNALCQNKTTSFISEGEAITIAKQHGVYPKFIFCKARGEIYLNSKMDTVGKSWTITCTRVNYTKRGKTTKQFAADRCKPCKMINGCHVVRTRMILIDAVTGRVIKKEKTKEVSGNYE